MEAQQECDYSGSLIASPWPNSQGFCEGIMEVEELQILSWMTEKGWNENNENNSLVHQYLLPVPIKGQYNVSEENQDVLF